MTAASYTPSRAIPAEDIRKWDLETDVAIVGFGIAGACAAIEARMALGLGFRPDEIYTIEVR